MAFAGKDAKWSGCEPERQPHELAWGIAAGELLKAAITRPGPANMSDPGLLSLDFGVADRLLKA